MLKTIALGEEVVPGHCHRLRRILRQSFHAGSLIAIELVFESSSAVRFAQICLKKRNRVTIDNAEFAVQSAESLGGCVPTPMDFGFQFCGMRPSYRMQKDERMRCERV